MGIKNFIKNFVEIPEDMRPVLERPIKQPVVYLPDPGSLGRASQIDAEVVKFKKTIISAVKSKFDRNSYMRDYMAKRRAKLKEKL